MPQKRTLDKAASKKPTGAAGYRTQREEGQLWEAPSGAVIRIRPLDITDHVVINQFPENLQQLVYRMIERSQVLSDDPGDDTDDKAAARQEAAGLFKGLSGKEVVEQAYDLSVRICKLAWIDPQVVDAVTDPDTQISVDELKSSDRTGFMSWAFKQQDVEAADLATFPGQPE